MQDAAEELLMPDPGTGHEDLELEGLPGDGAESNFNKPNLFLWILTLSAGISGLLFGYEYLCSAISSPRCHDADFVSQHWSHLRHADPYRIRLIKPTLEHFRQEPDNIMHESLRTPCEPSLGRACGQGRAEDYYPLGGCTIHCRSVMPSLYQHPLGNDYRAEHNWNCRWRCKLDSAAVGDKINRKEQS